MKIHPMTSAGNSRPGTNFSSYNLTRHSHALVPQAEAGCIVRCVGPSAATQCSHCGNDFACWDQCAGNGRGNCVSDCFNE